MNHHQSQWHTWVSVCVYVWKYIKCHTEGEGTVKPQALIIESQLLAQSLGGRRRQVRLDATLPFVTRENLWGKRIQFDSSQVLGTEDN